MRNIIFYLSLFTTSAFAQSSSQSVSTITDPSDYTTQLEYGSIVTLPPTITPSSFSSLSSGAILSGSSSPNATASGSSNSTSHSPSHSSTPKTLSKISGGTRIPGTTTAAAPRPSNTQPCNNYPEFCTRRYSNITEIAAHNSPFARERNAQSNQQYSVTQQLNDGIRVLQGQAHYINDTLYYCHTSCDLLNTGPVEDYLREVVAWLDRNPFEVITIIFGNYDWTKRTSSGDSPLVTSSNFVAPVEASGLLRYIYQPPSNAMRLSDWPTLGEMILQNKRVVTFIDYNFNTTEVPWLGWEFYNVWETPFSPTNVSFPCTVQRPSGISRDQASSMMYMANHNLNTEVAIGGTRILVPNVAHLAQTNGEEGEGSLGQMVKGCEDMWDGRPPNFLLVDYYNYGVPNGSVFRVAAEANKVRFNNRPCCGTDMSSTSVREKSSLGATALALAMVALAACLL
ncbi:PLC-like phosphodiesterase [Periconia macrospinosa]|uniref:PLC-like phosphodiesterase n=1 Tax=Periconia macrospinosa TaxID=97972 RepID=A0A2V1D5X3_9PLEO|nr:PLC-like phosphodiesterase [Periconia macrospinosa]